ncbi:MAG: hypothetical protein KA085_05870 [Phenylobacterium sp.]|uniref:hypothetical protein n=1 Tax=Phenylobacterium sp. TaxID=1871053 RepID=UPI001B585F06|nr:hypothetical protein [Phenylobacterium sp.]MBP7651400.1 hypothetical protein [Phenylobacterium sp.]MBP7815633.1 hypothetical protein [Phenylobacterium sp.]MBP9229899.1 hypothetical protein [Phenylobacterium sp.]MBP9754183.1 hypothetical protein [Phenylobacterium sp.]
MKRRAIIGLGISCLLASCAHQGQSGLPGMAWSLDHAEGEGAKLAYGQPQSDNVLIMMTCQPRSGQVLVSMNTPMDAPSDAINLASKHYNSRLAAETTPGMGEGAVYVEAKAPVTDPTLASFAASGDLSVVANGRKTPMPVSGAERGTVNDFFASCRA